MIVTLYFIRNRSIIIVIVYVGNYSAYVDQRLCCALCILIMVVRGVSKRSVNGTRKQTKQKIQTNYLYWTSK
jgi:hypothetical protein